MQLHPVHAHYPFLDGAREAVTAADVDLLEVIRTDDTTVERAVERITSAIDTQSVGEPHPSTRVELLSYPVARVIVSLLNVPRCTRRYARAEATRAISLLERDAARTRAAQSRPPLKSLQSHSQPAESHPTSLDYAAFIDRLGYADRIEHDETHDEYHLALSAYLELASPLSEDRWALANQTLDAGTVYLPAGALGALLRGAIIERVRRGLPLDVPDTLADELEHEVDRLETLLSEQNLVRDIETVVPELFPPCMQAIIDKIQAGERVTHSARFAIAAFLSSIGMTTDEMVEFFEISSEFGEEMTRYQVDHIRGDTSPTQYDPPTCATMQSYGDCYNKDERCTEVINESHPLVYYESILEETDTSDGEGGDDDKGLLDWREREGERGGD